MGNRFYSGLAEAAAQPAAGKRPKWRGRIKPASSSQLEQPVYFKTAVCKA